MDEPRSLTEEQRNELLFTQIVIMFQGAAMQQLGKVKNPVTDKIERDLDHARNSIDILGMLEVKTKGNLTTQEDQFLQLVLSELRLNYVDEVKKPVETQPESEKEPEGETEKKQEETPENEIKG